MTLSKEWLKNKIDLASKTKEEHTLKDSQNSLFYQGMVLAYQDCYTELTKTPIPKDPTLPTKEPDWNEKYKNIVTYYIKIKHYDTEHANAIAMKVITEQKQRRNINNPK